MDKKKINIAIEQLQKVHRDMNDCVNRFILKDAIDQLQEQVKKCSIPVVVGQSEQLVCDKCDEDGWIVRNEGDIISRRLCNCDKAN